jgi:hypothetical protein
MEGVRGRADIAATRSSQASGAAAAHTGNSIYACAVTLLHPDSDVANEHHGFGSMKMQLSSVPPSYGFRIHAKKNRESVDA